MEVNPIQFSKSNPDSGKINKVLKWLRESDENEKFAFIWTVLSENTHLGLRLVKASQFSPIHLQVIFERGLVYSDASSINHWIKAVINNLGHKRLLKILQSHITKTPLGVYKTLYWLPSIYENQSDEIKNEMKELFKEFKNTHPNFSTTTSVGSHPCTGGKSENG